MPEINVCPPLLWDKLLSEFPPEDRTLTEMLHIQAFKNSDRTLYEFQDFKVTYSQAESIAARGAQTLASAGVSRGDRVAMICGNTPEFFEVFLGAAWLGAITIPLNTATRGAQLQHMLTNSGATLLVAQKEYLDRLEHIQLSSTSLSQILAITDNPGEEISVAGFEASAWQLDDSESDAATISPGDPLAILYTSGTTGVSKGVICSHAQYFWWAYHNANILELAAGDRLHTTLPVFHTNALSSFFQALLTGSAVYFGNRFSASGFLDSIRSTEANVTYLLGAMVPILLSTPPTANDRNHNLRVILAPGVPAKDAQEFEDRFGTILLDGFASTESNFVIGATYSDLPEMLARPVHSDFSAGVRGRAVVLSETDSEFAKEIAQLAVENGAKSVISHVERTGDPEELLIRND